jgi:hypothetical protein
MMNNDKAPATYGFFFGITVGFLVSAWATGYCSQSSLGFAALHQTYLLEHLGIGSLLVVPLLAYVPYHLYVVFQRESPTSAWGGHLQGLLLLGAIGVALWSGGDLVLHGATRARAHIVHLHQLSAHAVLVLLAVHLIWAAWRRRQLGRGVPLATRERVFLPLALLTASLALGCWLGVALRPPDGSFPIPKDYTQLKNKKGERGAFFPGQARTMDGKFIPVSNLSGSSRCGACHAEIYQQWRSSTHSFAAANDHYMAQVKLRMHDVPIKPHLGARFCANCHEDIALLAGEVDPHGRGIEIPENRDEGISCLVCHRVEALHNGTM